MFTTCDQEGENKEIKLYQGLVRANEDDTDIYLDHIYGPLKFVDKPGFSAAIVKHIAIA